MPSSSLSPLTPSPSFTTLISANELAQHLNEKNWIVLDCRHALINTEAGRIAFNEGHIPNAQFVHLDDDLSGNKVNSSGLFCGRHPLPDRAMFVAKCRSWGINDDTQVIVYDAHGGIFAARCWWMLRWIGHEAVAVLDGGLPAWMAENHSLSREIVVPQLGSVNDKPPLVKTVNVEDVLANMQSDEMKIIDARSPDRFRGENETLDKIGGHIPGAKNHFFKNNLKPSGCFKSASDLRAEFSLIVKDPQLVVTQCGSGVTACHNLLGLEVAGMHGAALYVGSWSEWCADPLRPVVAEKIV
ncbi:MAG: sseA2 [Solimicrobium sp.]|nr:sseA2 [Solimicrobium sp.]